MDWGCAMKRGGMRHPNDNHMTRNVVMLAFEGSEIIDVVGPMDVFAAVNHISRESGIGMPYRLAILADTAGPIATSSGLMLIAEGSWRVWKDEIDTLIVSGGPDPSVLTSNKSVIEWIRSKVDSVRRLVSICTGAFVLAEAGVLHGRRATTHWMATRRLSADYPGVTVEIDPIFVRDGSVYTSAGVTAGMDLALSLVEEDFGREMAIRVARLLVLYLKRPGGQSQYSSQLRAQGAEGGRLSELLTWMGENYLLPLTVEMLAERVAMSPRTFARTFVAETGTTPARYLEQIRVEHAIRFLEESNSSMEEIAENSGFRNVAHFRRSFWRHAGITPRSYRDRFQSTSRSNQENARS